MRARQLTKAGRATGRTWAFPSIPCFSLSHPVDTATEREVPPFGNLRKVYQKEKGRSSVEGVQISVAAGDSFPREAGSEVLQDMLA